MFPQKTNLQPAAELNVMQKRNSTLNKIYISIALLIFQMSVNAEEYRILERISYDTLIALENRINSGIDSDFKIVIESPGGDMLSAIAIGQIIFDNKINIEVNFICASACANYIFPSGNKKYLSKNAMIIFHGGLLQKNIIEQMKSIDTSGENNVSEPGKEVNLFKIEHPQHLLDLLSINGEDDPRKAILELQELETKFYKKIGVKQEISTYGQIGKYKSKYESKEYFGFYYSLNSLEKLGVKNIQSIDAPKPSEMPNINEHHYLVDY